MARPPKSNPPEAPPPEPPRKALPAVVTRTLTPGGDLPTVRALGYAKVKAGYVALHLEICGSELVSAETLHDRPESRAYVGEVLKLALIRDLLPDMVGGKA